MSSPAHRNTHDVTPFHFDSASIRVVTIDGDPWFVAKDLSDSLGYVWNGTARIAHVPAEWRGVTSVVTPSGKQEMAVMSEQGLYFFLARSDKPNALPMQKWVAGEVLPSIRRTGSYQVRPMSHLEILAAQAQALVEQERRTLAVEQAVADLNQQLKRVAESRVWDRCPQNCEPITKIRARIGKKYGFPAWVIDAVMRELPLSPKVHAMIRNGHENASGSQYEVWAVADVTRTFARFASECERMTACFVTHPDLHRPFRMAPEVSV